ncbi:ABC transporter substrate-binding protein [Varunaivibrio sulfuroxidans]|uniref:Amino acid ABC transporter substrate-binding protein (PAAT family) n=1 Tax=Varunaivibrio sulfuroxidans TaxID=1773489 RepID=A0A4R3JBD9_9PROT|nr:ABC transporter substrate-binding protein [Varunaivibrio sulfuroxidans]TCS62605.1 amino acid ABC transporter substrate-binding protein (PAAT family) [Varunaivibrio sulfuroxidans]WES30727.1 ABC transporter substrate-binding protein [Varunaivibrio sulfuroxidans]
MFFKKIALAAVAVMAFGATAQASETIRIGTEGAYPPFNQIDPNGKVVGFDIDIANALCDVMKVKCEFVTQDWDGLIPALKVKKFDAIIAFMSITDKRKKAVDFTDPYCSNTLGYVAKKGSTLNIDDLNGKTIGAQRATISATYLADHVKGAKVKLYDTQENAYLDLSTGRTDAVLADNPANYEWLRSDAGKGFVQVGKPVDINDKIGIAVRKGDPLRERLNAALKVILANGTYQKINKKYFPFSIY